MMSKVLLRGYCVPKKKFLVIKLLSRCHVMSVRKQRMTSYFFALSCSYCFANLFKHIIWVRLFFFFSNAYFNFLRPTCACVNNTLRFLRWARGNCIGLTSQGESPADMVMFPMFMPVEAGDPLINLETVTVKSKHQFQHWEF